MATDDLRIGQMRRICNGKQLYVVVGFTGQPGGVLVRVIVLVGYDGNARNELHEWGIGLCRNDDVIC